MGERFAERLGTLVRNGQADVTSDGLFLSYEQLTSLPDQDACLFDALCRWSPFTIELSSHSALGLPDFRLRIRYLRGDLEVLPERVGAFLRLQGTTYRLGDLSRQLLDLAEDLNSWPEERRADRNEVLLRWAAIQALANTTGTELDEYLRGERVVAPEQVHLDLSIDNAGRVSVVPSFNEIPDEPLQREYLRFGTVQDTYTVPLDDGGRLRVVIRPQVARALERVRTQRRLGARDQDRLLSRPQALLGDEPEGTVADVVRFGPRVKGIGPYPAFVRAFVSSGEQWAEIGGEGLVPLAPPHAALECVDYEGNRQELSFESPESSRTLIDSLKSAIDRGDPVVDYCGIKLPATPGLVAQLESVVREVEAVTAAPPTPESTPPRGPSVGVLVYEAPDYVESLGTPTVAQIPVYPRPRALRPGVELQPHQEDGLRWLQHSFALGSRKGVLLADDMGLGKTLQVLAFLAWLVEQPLRDTLGADTGPYDPILVVAPLVLLDELGWKGQLERFLESSVLTPYVVLHGKEIAAHRRMSGSERHEARPLLDLDSLRTHRLVITNYETLVNYQLSFSAVRWSVLVADEAHFFKEPDTKVSFTMKALDALFRIAMTGTPVQNRLRDVWNIVDFLQPGSVLGSARDFETRFESQLHDVEAQAERLRELRGRLGLGRPDALLIRRSKDSHLPGLPRKHERRANPPLSEVQRAAHVAFVNEYRGRQGQSGTAFSLLAGLSKLSQHPALVGYGSLSDPVDRLLEACPKLSTLVDELRKVRMDSEKALIFAFFRDMQQLLKRVVDEIFGLDVDIMNGQPGQSGRKLVQARTDMVRRFERQAGFNVLILAPEVAGVGLTIVEANHVFHYGRWWNPAVEDQATDRVHRIGQLRDVHVHQLVTIDPLQRFRTFDERLDTLLERKRAAARDFLAPRDEPHGLGAELAAELLDDEATGSEPSGVLPTICDSGGIDRLDPFELEALVAAMLERSGTRVVLTPRDADRGIDVIGVRQNDVLLVRIHHATHHGRLQTTVVDEMLAAAAFYRENVLPPQLRTRRLVPAIYVTEDPDRAVRREAESRRIELLGGSLLLERLRAADVTYAALEHAESCRTASLDDVRARLDSLVPAAG